MMRLSAGILALLALSLSPSATDAQTNSCSDSSTDDIISLACDSGNSLYFGTLCDALKETGIDGSITKFNGVYTVFAPFNTAFDAAGRRIGVTLPQKQATLQYHIVNGEFNSPECGQDLNTLLFWGGVQQSVEFDCTNNVVTGVSGDINLPVASSADPLIRSINDVTTGDPPRINACNGVIYLINNVLGFDRVQYNWPLQPCAFNDPNCRRPIYGTKGAKGGVVIVEETVGDLTFVSTVPAPKASKADWNFSPYQSVYANGYFGPYAPGFGAGYGYGYGGYGYRYGNKKAKGHYGGYYGGFGGYGGKGYGYGWRKNRRRNRRLSDAELAIDEDEMLSMEDVLYMEPANEKPASSAGDKYYSYRKNRNLRRGQ
eukprot:CAMPEP_0197183656 /NCGR_PEP_ID=MMETSP1423-20130617/7939_1 /TAXON_ID=476441 /ORGANISM="Pseudo-nitzschia heimii, Strain UNC1101" /LENGTH=371 /DNA_ID=CAMNT_0042634257 /DNA_START=89 /DNA_END=1204 /DNA_ORIENTATION=+